MTSTIKTDVLNAAQSGGGVAVQHDGSTKVRTTSTGIDVTGTVTADHISTTGVAAISSSSPNIKLMETDTTDQNYRFRVQAGRLLVENISDASSQLSVPLVIDTSGNLLVGKTTTGDFVTGIEMQPAGAVLSYRTSGVAAIHGRTDDGEIIRLTSNGSTVGNIGASLGGLYIADTGVGFRFDSGGPDDIIPCNSTGGASDDSINLGASGARFDDIYATNGTIQTSDRNDKQDIEALTEAETRVAQACKGLLRKFRWQSAVAEKGDEARTHFGIIAQDLQAAFEAEGLDAGDYAMFISSTWWEATETYTDDEGVEQTRVNTYNTQDEAPEGATERTRMGVRYPELLAFMVAAL